MNKKKSEFIHLQKRWLQRIGTYLTKDAHNQIVKLIQSNKTTFVYKQSNRVSIHNVQIGDRVVKVAYDRIRKQCITVLPGG